MKRKLFFAATLLILNLVAKAIPNVPYFFQYYNSYQPGGSCQNTCVAMIINYYGGNETPDDISNYWGTDKAKSVPGWDEVFNAEANYFGLSITASGTYSGTFAQLHSYLDQGIPVVIHGDFTASGHVMVVLGYDGNSYICNDPAGEWSQQYKYGGYCQCSGTAGKQVVYGKSAFEQATGPDGNLWIHWFDGVQPNSGKLPRATTDAADCSSIRGWAYDPDVPNTSINVDIYIGGTKVYGGITGTPRSDVNAAFGISGDHGYDLPIPGEYQDGINRIVDVYAINNSGPNVLVSSSDLQCGSLVPKFTLDIMDCDELRGWAYDPDVSSSSIDVHLYVDNNMVAAIPTNDSRADVNAAFGISGTHGFVYTVPDLYKDGQTHTFALYAINNDGYNALNSATTFGPCYVIPSGFNAQPNTCPNIGVTLNWQHTANGFFLDIGTDPNFAMGTFFNKDVSSLTSVVCPGGFCEYTGGACNGNYLDFQPNTTYYWRIFNGSVHTSAGSFTTPSCSYVDNSNCSGSFSDMGAGANYTDNEDYTYTYSPPGASSVDVQFTTFGTENGYDFLYLYDGNSTSAPLIGTYTGNTLPNGGNKISSTGGSITMKFHSDPFTNDIGFTGTYSCSQISTSINEANTSKLLISPNPSNGVFHITLPKNFTGNASELTVVDVVGKEVLHLVNPEAITVIDLPVKGIYFLQLKNENSLVSQKIIVQ